MSQLKIISNGVDETEIRSGFQTVTPEMAEKWLEKNTNNRGVSDTRVRQLAEAMRRGEWRLTHQGVAFGADGSLYDGQHRLWAIMEAAVPIRLMVTTGLSEDTRANIDGQRSRSVADNFAILSNMPHAKRTVEIANIIQMLVTGEASFKGSYDQTELLVKRYKTDLAWAVELPGGTTRFGSAPVRGGLAFALRTDPKAVAAFAEQVLNGANLPERSPALILRNYIMSGRRMGSGAGRRDLAVRVCRAVYAHLHGEEIRSIFATEDSVAYFGKAHGLTLSTSSANGHALQQSVRHRAKTKAAR